jgi:hypothetical protein
MDKQHLEQIKRRHRDAVLTLHVGVSDYITDVTMLLAEIERQAQEKQELADRVEVLENELCCCEDRLADLDTA